LAFALYVCGGYRRNRRAGGLVLARLMGKKIGAQIDAAVAEGTHQLIASH